MRILFLALICGLVLCCGIAAAWNPADCRLPTWGGWQAPAPTPEPTPVPTPEEELEKEVHNSGRIMPPMYVDTDFVHGLSTRDMLVDCGIAIAAEAIAFVVYSMISASAAVPIQQAVAEAAEVADDAPGCFGAPCRLVGGMIGGWLWEP